MFETLLNAVSGTFCFIENLALLSALRKGSGTVADFGCLVHSLHLQLAGLQCRAWYEHVDSNANVADGGSRVGPSCPEAKRLGIDLIKVPLPHWPKRPLDAGPEHWLGSMGGKGTR